MNIVCPLCGRHVPENVFDPSDFENDIYGVEVSGLGRGRGFRVTSSYSLLNIPSITGLISDRCHQILHLIHSSGYVPPQEFSALRATLDQWVKYGRRLEAENAELREENEELSMVDDDVDDGYAEMSRLLRKINREISFDFDSLEEAVMFLLER
jgi:hypothetical protein